MLMTTTENLNAPRNDGWSPWLLPAYQGYVEIAKILVSKLKNHWLINDGMTPLQIPT